jgi:hypothetical protein
MNDHKRVVYGPETLAKNPKPQTIVLLIKHPKTIYSKALCIQQVHTSISNMQWETNAHVTYII